MPKECTIIHCTTLHIRRALQNKTITTLSIGAKLEC